MFCNTIMDLNVFVIHVQSLTHRKVTCEKLRSMIENLSGTHFEYITNNDPTEIKNENIRKFLNYEPFKEEDLKPFNGFLRNLHLNHLSNALKHMEALEKAASSNKPSLIIEDDMIFNDNIVESIKSILKNHPKDADVVFLGLPSIKETTSVYQNVRETFPILPCCDSYIIMPSAARKLFDALLPIKFSTNVQLSYLFKKLDMNVVSIVPNVFVDGSKFGLYYSTLEVNNRLIFNSEYVTLAKLIHETESFSEEDITKINNLFMNIKLKTNPEFYHLKALFETKIGNAEYAKYIFQYALSLYENNGCIINSQSQFLKDYMRVYKHLQ